MPRRDARKRGSFRGYALPSGLQDPPVFAPETFIVRAVDDGMAPRVNAGDCLNADPDAPAALRFLPEPQGRTRKRAAGGNRCLKPRGISGMFASPRGALFATSRAARTEE